MATFSRSVYGVRFDRYISCLIKEIEQTGILIDMSSIICGPNWMLLYPYLPLICIYEKCTFTELIYLVIPSSDTVTDNQFYERFSNYCRYPTTLHICLMICVSFTSFGAGDLLQGDYPNIRNKMNNSLEI